MCWFHHHFKVDPLSVAMETTTRNNTQRYYRMLIYVHPGQTSSCPPPKKTANLDQYYQRTLGKTILQPPPL